MTRIEQINWARQILSQSPTAPERDDETVKYLTEANLKLREALEAMTSKRDEATERAHRHLATATNWRHKATELTAKLDAAGRVNKGLVEQIGKLKTDLQESLLKSYNYELEIARLKHRVNGMIRKDQSRRSKP